MNKQSHQPAGFKSWFKSSPYLSSSIFQMTRCHPQPPGWVTNDRSLVHMRKVDNEIMKMSYCVPRVNILTNENLNTYSTEFKRCLINSRNYLFPAIWNHCNTIFDLCVSVNVNTYFKLETYRFSLLKYLMGQFARLFFLTTYEVISLNY